MLSLVRTTGRRLSRRAVVVAGAGACGALLAGACGQDGGGAQPAPAGRPATVEVLSEFGPNGDNGQALLAVLQRLQTLAPTLTVRHTVTSGDAWPVLLTTLAAGTAPDVSETFVANGASLGSKGIAVPLQTALKGTRDWSPDDYFDGPREAFTYKGDLLLAPMFSAPMAVAVNLQAVERAGLKAPPATWTWEDFTQAAIRLTQRSGGETGVYGASTPTGNGFGAMNFFGGPLWSHGGEWANRGSGRVAFQDPPGVAALEMWVNLALRQQAAPATMPESWRGLQTSPFANGLTAMAFVASPAMRAYLREATAFPWTTLPMPRQRAQGSHFYAHGFFALRASKEQAAAAELVRLLSLPAHVALWNVTTFGIATRKSAATLKEWQEHVRATPALNAFNETVRYTRSYPPIPGWNEASQGPEGIGQAIIDAVQGKSAPRPALEEAARRADVFLTQYQ